MPTATSLKNLKEQRLPKYIKGTSWELYNIKLLGAAKTRGRMYDSFTGVILKEHNDIWKVVSESNAPNAPTAAQNAILKELEEENERAFDELVQCMPTERLTKIVHDEKTDTFPDGCARSAYLELERNIYETSSGNKRILKDKFERKVKFNSKANPTKYIERITSIKDELKNKYGCIKTDDDILDQLLKVLGHEYSYIKNDIKTKRRKGEDVSLKDIKEALKEEYQDIKLNSKDNSETSESNEDSSESEELEKGLCAKTTASSNSVLRVGEIQTTHP